MEKENLMGEALASLENKNMIDAGAPQSYDPPHIPDTSQMRDYQMDCLKAIKKAGDGKHLIVMATGLGKCFAPGTEMMMSDGTIRKVESIEEGEEVMGPDYTPRRVIGCTYGHDEMYKITQSNGMTYTVNSVHILSLYSTAVLNVRIDGIKCCFYPGQIINIPVTDYLFANQDFKEKVKGWKIDRNEKITLSDITVECVGEGTYYGFELIGKDRLFLLKDQTVVHNTFVFSHIPRKGRMLILSHRDELVHQPEKYFDCSFGVEQAEERSHGEEVVSASVQSLIRRLDSFDPYAFDTIITDEAHHATAKSYQKIYEYFKPRVHLGFTATPNRGDKEDLKKVYDDVIFFKDARWGISHNYLCDVDCYRVDVGYDLSKAKKVMGDFKQADLDKAINKAGVTDAVAEAYRTYAKGQTLIFAANVKHANAIAEKIEGAVVVTGETPNRAEIIDKFTKREIPCIVNCMVFTEGTDMPLIETIIMARPTANQTLYCQAVGRGLRLYPGKEKLTLIDCVGASRLSLCTAPTLFGLNCDVVPKEKRNMVQGLLSKMDAIIDKAADCPQSWISSAERIPIFEEENNISVKDVNWIIFPDESMRCNIGGGITIVIPAANAIGQTEPYMTQRLNGQDVIVGKMPPDDLQSALDAIYAYLVSSHSKTRALWDNSAISSGWGADKVSPNQTKYIKTLMEKCGRKYEKTLSNITKKQASVIIDHLLYEINNAEGVKS